MRTEAVHTGTYVVEESAKNATYQGYQILHWGFVAAPILAGLDKFFMKLTDWTMYLWPPLAKLTGGAGTFMRIVGAIEIVAGCLVAFKPKIGAPIVVAWLAGGAAHHNVATRLMMRSSLLARSGARCSSIFTASGSVSLLSVESHESDHCEPS